MGLSKKYEHIAGNIMAMEPLPNLNRAFHLVQQAEKQIINGQQMGMKASAFAVNKMNQGGSEGNFQRRETKAMKIKKRCTRCNMRGHLKEECFKLITPPEWFKNLKTKKFARKCEQE